MISLETLKAILLYNPESGDWVWLDAGRNNHMKNGTIAGSVRHDGYRRIRIGGRGYYSGRLAFFYMTGRWPEEVDHIDRNPSNDKWSNLREATSSQNKYNRSLSGGIYRGVYPCGDKWQVQVEGIYFGVYESLEEAIAIRDMTAKEWSGGFALLNTGTNS